MFAELTGADVCVLDQMTVTNVSDQEALDDFLNSTGDDTSAVSSLTSGNPKPATPQPVNIQQHTVSSFLLVHYVVIVNVAYTSHLECIFCCVTGY